MKWQISKWVMIALLGISNAEDTGLARRELARAQLAELRGDAVAAKDFRERARLAHPNAIDLTRQCAADRRDNHDIRGASTLFRELAAARQDSLEAQLLYADFLRDVGEGDDFALNLAVRTLEQAKTNFPQSSIVWEKLFRLHEQRGHRETSQLLYNEYLKHPDAEPATAETMARVMNDANDMKARKMISQLYLQRFDAEPENPITARNASEHLRKHGDKEGAIDILTRHIAANPSSLDLRVRLGILLLESNRQETGEKELLEILRIDPEKHVAHQSLAKLYTMQEKAIPARHHRSELLRIRGGDEEEFIILAKEWMTADEPAKALLLLEKARFEHGDSNEIAWLQAVAAHADPQSRPKAEKMFQAAAELDRDKPCANPQYLRAAADSYWAAGKKEDAEKFLRRAITLYPRDDKKNAPEALRQLASWWHLQGKNEQATKPLLDRAAALEK